MRSSIFQSLDERCALKLNAQLKTNFLAKLSQSAPSAVQIDLSDSFHYKCQTGQTSFATRSKLWVWFKYKVNSSLFIILIGLGDTGFRMFGQINELFLARKLNEQWTYVVPWPNECLSAVMKFMMPRTLASVRRVSSSRWTIQASSSKMFLSSSRQYCRARAFTKDIEGCLLHLL